MSDKQISEVVAGFFNKISRDYTPIPDPDRKILKDYWKIHVMPHEVSARLKTFKKPKSRDGDIDPKLVNTYYDLLALPLTFIFNQVLNTLHWPKLWKAETVTVIPKNSSPASLSELRNLSCTPLFSKVLESFVLQKLKGEVKLSPSQYEGIKGRSTTHFLLDTWDTVLTALEHNNSAVNLTSIDFEKAFNQMDHLKCLEALLI